MASEAFLPEVLSKVSVAIEAVDPPSLLKSARDLEALTPASFVALLDRSCWGSRGYGRGGLNEEKSKIERQSLRLMLKAVGSWSCLPIAADEAIGFVLKDWGVVEDPKERERSRSRSSPRKKKRAGSAESRGSEEIVFQGMEEEVGGGGEGTPKVGAATPSSSMPEVPP